MAQHPACIDTVTGHASLAIFASGTGGDAIDQDFVTLFEPGDGGSYFLYNTNSLVAQNPSWLTCGNIASEDVEVGTLVKLKNLLYVY
jgi:hypothetical protein